MFMAVLSIISNSHDKVGSITNTFVHLNWTYLKSREMQKPSAETS